MSLRYSSDTLPWFQDVNRIENSVVILIYIQIGCSIVGSIGAMLNGVLLVNLALSMFTLVLIDNRRLTVERAYLVFLASSILLDIVWLSLFSQIIWNIPSSNYELNFVFTVRLTLLMQLLSFFVRSLLSILLIQMYRLGRTSPENNGSNNNSRLSSHSASGFYRRFGPHDDAGSASETAFTSDTLFDSQIEQVLFQNPYAEESKRIIRFDSNASLRDREKTQSMPSLGGFGGLGGLVGGERNVVIPPRRILDSL